MKDSNTSLTIRTKVESSNLNNNSSLTPLVQSFKFGNNSSLNTSTAQQSHNNSNNSDDEFECEGLGIGNLIIDLDADIKSDERLSSENESHYTATAKNSISKSTNKSPNTTNLRSLFDVNPNMSTSSKTIRDVNNGNQGVQTQQTNNKTNSSNQFQSTTSDNSLKLKLKRKSIGGKSSESKLEIVQSSSSSTNTNNSNSTTEVEKIKHHSSSKNKNSSHKEKKEKKERKDKNSNLSSTNSSSSTKNGNIDPITQLDSKEQQQRKSPVVVLNLDKKVQNQSDHPFNQINQLKKETNSLDAPSLESPPFKKSKTEDVTTKNTHYNSSVPLNGASNKPETRSVSTATDVSTMTEPECLGYCEPGSAICLEGITWAEAEGVLVVNVTWRGKSYVGTLLDCTRHDWGPPRLCDSPTSDLESKGLKSGRGKRARSSISEQDSRLFQSKLRNGKGRRNNFTVPASPLKVDQQNKRNSRNGKDANTDKSNSQQSNRNTPTPTTIPESNNSSSIADSPLSKPPLSPVLIECPEPNCCKKYRHANGLKYHQTHAHKGDGLDDTSKETTDNEELETDCVENSLTNKSTEKECNDKMVIENSSDKKLKQNCDRQSNKHSDNDAQSPAYSDISDVGESSNGNETNESSTKTSSCSTGHQQNSKSASDKKEDESLKTNESTNLNNNNSDQNSRENDTAKGEITKSSIKEENHHNPNNEKEQPSVSPNVNNGIDKNGHKMLNNLTNRNSNSPLQQQQASINPAAMNANQLQFPFNMLPTYSGLPMDPAFHAYFMQQDRFLMDEQQKQMIAQQQHKASLSPQLMNSQQTSQSQQQQQQSTSQFNQSLSNQLQSQSSQNKPSSPYDFIQHQEKQQEMLKLTNRNADDRFMNKNSLGNRLPPSPKQSQPPSTSVQQLFNQHQTTTSNSLSSNNNLVKDEHRTTPKQPKQDEGIKATMESQGPPPASNSFYSMPFLGPQGISPFDPFRAQQAVAFNHPNAAFMNNLRFPLGAPQLPMMGSQMTPQQMSGQDMNNKMNSGPLSNANGNNKKAYEMLQQVSQQYNLKEMQDKMLISSNSANKNGQPVGLSNNPRQSSNHLGMPSIQTPGHPSIQMDPFSALLKQAASFPK